MKRPSSLLQSQQRCFLFIYLVRLDPVREGEPETYRYCTLLVYGRNREAAEEIAINRVHQEGLHIVRADTATAAPWLDPASDGEYLAELAQYGCALRLSEADHTGRPATAA